MLTILPETSMALPSVGGLVGKTGSVFLVKGPIVGQVIGVVLIPCGDGPESGLGSHRQRAIHDGQRSTWQKDSRGNE